MRHRFLSHKLWGAATAGALICAITLTASAIPDHKRTAGDRASVDIENFGKVNDHFYRGAQPKGRNYEQLAALGIKTIVDLREDAKDDARSATERAGMRYFNLPMKEKSYPQAETAARFLQIVNDQAYQEMKRYDFSTSWGHGCYKDYVFDYYRDLQAQSQKQRIAPTRSDN